MCDTMGAITATGAFFAKNSDRSPNEVQVLEYHAPKSGLTGDVKCTYISVPQAAETYGVLLSRPDWMWGAEMGVNQWGVCIGNEAVFTKGRYGKPALTGMDMVRLALERSKTAKEALECLINLLETYGQGGNCGFDHEFHYDNGFLIMDANALYVLETAGKQWVWKEASQANISNRLSIGSEWDACSCGAGCDFRKKYTEPVFTFFSGSAKRYGQLRESLPQGDSLAGCMAALRKHDHGAKPFAAGSVSSACMHYGGLVGDHTTSSMVVTLEKGKITVWATGSSLPCVSLFKPWRFGTEPVLPVVLPDDPAARAYWLEAETFRRKLLGRIPPNEYYVKRNALEKKWMEEASALSAKDFPAFSRHCLEEEKEFFAKWDPDTFPAAATAPGFRSRWNKKTKVLFPKA